MLQSLGIIPFAIGPFKVKCLCDLRSFLMWGLLVWVYVWLVEMLWRVDKKGLAVPGGYLGFQPDPGFHLILGAATTISSSSVLNAIILSTSCCLGVKSGLSM